MKRSYLQRKSTWKPKPLGYSWRSSSTLKRSRLRVRRDPKLAAWSKAVRERDGNQCQWPGGCQTGDTRIDAHHIAERSLRPDLKYSTANGVALCRQHHDWLPLNREAAIAMGLLSNETYEIAKRDSVKGQLDEKLDNGNGANRCQGLQR
jgi:hypothetical protein